MNAGDLLRKADAAITEKRNADMAALFARYALEKVDEGLAASEKEVEVALAKLDPKHVAEAKRYLEVS